MFVTKVIRLLQLSILSLLGVYLLFGLLLFLLQRKYIYFPTPAVNLGFVETELHSGDEVIKLIALHEHKDTALLYFGGNAESVAYSAQEFDQALSSLAVYLMQYRGYGGSTGSPSEQGLYQDALAAYDRLTLKHQRVYVLGRSLGSGVATYVAAHRNVQKLVLVTPYDSILSIAQTRFPMYPVSLMLRDQYDSVGRAQNIHSATLIILAEQDSVVPAEHSRRLIQSLNHLESQVVELKGAGHNTLAEHPHYLSALQQFLSE